MRRAARALRPSPGAAPGEAAHEVRHAARALHSERTVSPTPGNQTGFATSAEGFSSRQSPVWRGLSTDSARARRGFGTGSALVRRAV